jgi:hypothetical protein
MKKDVDKKLDDAVIANSLLVLLFEGILLSLSVQHLMTSGFLIIEAGFFVFAGLVFGIRRFKLICMSLVMLVYMGFFGVVLWSAYSIYITNNGSIFGIAALIMIPMYILYINLVAFIAILKQTVQDKKS